MPVEAGEAPHQGLCLLHFELQVVDQEAHAPRHLRLGEKNDMPVTLQTLGSLLSSRVSVLQADDARVAVPGDPQRRVVARGEQRHQGGRRVGVVVKADDQVVLVELFAQVLLEKCARTHAALFVRVVAHVHRVVPHLPLLCAQRL